MSCGILDVTCHVHGLLAPIWAFALEWWWVASHAGAMLVGAWLGPRATVVLLTAGIGLLVYDRNRK